MFAVADVTSVPKAFFLFVRFFRWKKRHRENEKWKIYLVQPNIRKKSVQSRERAIHWTPLAPFALLNSLCGYVEKYIRPNWVRYIVNSGCAWVKRRSTAIPSELAVNREDKNTRWKTVRLCILMRLLAYVCSPCAARMPHLKRIHEL